MSPAVRKRLFLFRSQRPRFRAAPLRRHFRKIEQPDFSNRADRFQRRQGQSAARQVPFDSRLAYGEPKGDIPITNVAFFKNVLQFREQQGLLGRTVLVMKCSRVGYIRANLIHASVSHCRCLRNETRDGDRAQTMRRFICPGANTSMGLSFSGALWSPSTLLS